MGYYSLGSANLALLKRHTVPVETSYYRFPQAGTLCRCAVGLYSNGGRVDTVLRATTVASFTHISN